MVDIREASILETGGFIWVTFTCRMFELFKVGGWGWLIYENFDFFSCTKYIT